jgi:F-type H+-transporting ATPase subunit epsilon
MSDGIPATIRLKVVTPRRLLVEADVEAVFLPTLEGQIGVLPGHRPLFVGMGRGRLIYREAGGEESFAIRGGYAQVQPEKVVVMTEVGEDDDSGDAAA